MRPVENVEGDEEERYQELAVQFQPLTVNLWEDKTIFNPRIKQNPKIWKFKTSSTRIDR